MPTMRAMPCGWAPMVLWCRIMAADSSMAPSPPPGRCPVVDAVGDDLTVLADSGVRSGVDVIRLLALGAKGVLLGRAYIYALAAAGEAGVAHLLRLFAEDMKVTMTLTGATSPSAISLDCLDRLEQDQHRTHAVPVSLPA